MGDIAYYHYYSIATSSSSEDNLFTSIIPHHNPAFDSFHRDALLLPPAKFADKLDRNRHGDCLFADLGQFSNFPLFFFAASHMMNYLPGYVILFYPKLAFISKLGFSFFRKNLQDVLILFCKRCLCI